MHGTWWSLLSRRSAFFLMGCGWARHLRAKLILAIFIHQEAFDFHMRTGKNKIEERTHYLNTMLKEGLKEMKHVKLHTPVSSRLSAAINCFEIDGLKPEDIVKKLHEKNIIANTSPYRISYARLTPCIINTEEEIKLCLEAIGNMKS